jgi:DNA-binding response OmpR family regulator
VLVIEDDRDIALGIRTVLTRSGFDVANSRDGKQGLRVFHTARPDLVVLDIGLPTLDGWQVLERIRDLSAGLLASRAGLLRRPRPRYPAEDAWGLRSPD